MRSFAALLPAVVLGSCTFSGLPADATLNRLSEEEALQLCEATRRVREERLSSAELLAFDCNLSADIAGDVSVASGGEHTEACEEVRQECTAAGEVGDDLIHVTWCEPGIAGTHFEACDISTVARYEACVREQLDSIEAAGGSAFSCAGPYFGPTAEAAATDGQQSACEAYTEDCGLPRIPLFSAP